MTFGKSKSSASLKRVSRGFSEFPRTLLVCEGEKTEPNYFKALIKALGLHAASVMIVGSECDSAPISIYEYAVERFNKDPGIDKVFCVFDRDRHATFESACDAIRRHPSRRFEAIVSDPCFEYWLLLHFKYTRAPITAQGSSSPGDVALKALRLEWSAYAKGASVFEYLRSRLNSAKSNSAAARLDAARTGNKNPSTDVDLLIAHLEMLAVQQLRPGRSS
jgi:hypothetical protein